MEEMFIQTDEQRAILETVRRFVAEVVTPKAPALDAMTDPAAGYSEEIVAAADAVGIRTMTLSEKYGGLAPTRSPPRWWWRNWRSATSAHRRSWRRP